MFYDRDSSSMDYSKRMTVLMGYVFWKSIAMTSGKKMEESLLFSARTKKGKEEMLK